MWVLEAPAVWTLSDWTVVVSWAVILNLAWRAWIIWLIPEAVRRAQIVWWKWNGEPDPDELSQTAIVAFSSNFRKPLAKKRIRIFLRRYEGWIDTEWRPGEGPTHRIRADKNTEDPVQSLIGDLEEAKWILVTVQIPRTYLWFSARLLSSVVFGSELDYARTILHVHRGNAPSAWGLYSYLRRRRQHRIVTPAAPSNSYPQTLRRAA